MRGSWRLIRGRRLVALELSPFVPIGRDDRVALAEEGMRLLTFLAADDGENMRVGVRFVSD